eukprot:m.71342 g.71342  ORF g.71342 m.71342 type:complete len:71 (-) comp11704_c0_seq3:2320-2532(-)
MKMEDQILLCQHSNQATAAKKGNVIVCVNANVFVNERATLFVLFAFSNTPHTHFHVCCLFANVLELTHPS